jgi:uncharacterized membrane protein YhaH (DUF805 family)
MDFGYLFTSFDGRINRKPFWIGILVLAAGAIFVSIVLGMLLGFNTRAFRVASFVLQLALIYPSAALMAKRLHDRSRPTWWLAIAFVPSILQGLLNAMGVIGDPLNPNTLDYLLGLIVFVIGVWFLVELGFLRGTLGANEYGPDPLEGRM